MANFYSSISIYSETLTEEELRGMWGEILDPDNLWEQEVGVVEGEGVRRQVYVQGQHGSWIDEKLETAPFNQETRRFDPPDGAIHRLLELRADVTEIHWRQEDYDARDATGVILTRDGRKSYSSELVPNGIRDRIKEVLELSEQGYHETARLVAESLLIDLQKGLEL